jgi:hypothetical protein
MAFNVSAEDDASHILKPLRRCCRRQSGPVLRAQLGPTRDVYLIAAVRDINPGLVIYDPWSAFIHLTSASSEIAR